MNRLEENLDGIIQDLTEGKFSKKKIEGFIDKEMGLDLFNVLFKHRGETIAVGYKDKKNKGSKSEFMEAANNLIEFISREFWIDGWSVSYANQKGFEITGNVS